MVLNGVVSATWQVLCYLRPPIPQSGVQLDYLGILLLREAGLFDIWRQMIVPSIKHIRLSIDTISGFVPFTALLSHSVS